MNIRDHLFNHLSSNQTFLFETWQPQGRAVVIGYSQNCEREVYVAICRKEGVPILRRRGGGGAVLLMPGVLCMTCAFTSLKSDSPYYFFQIINQWIIGLLSENYRSRSLMLRGISDICIEDRKIFGCSMFKSRHSFLYQGSLLVDCDVGLFSRYLKHPSREPDYRQGRPHERFTTTLRQEGYSITIDDLERLFTRAQSDLQRIIV